MGIFNWFNNIFTQVQSMTDDTMNTGIDDIASADTNDIKVNPANGLPMIGGIGGVDVEGNLYGTSGYDEIDCIGDDSGFGASDPFFDDMHISSFDDD